MLTDRNERPYMALVLADNTGEVEAMLWDRAAEQAQAFEEGDAITVAGKVNRFQGRLQLHLRSIAPAAPGARDPEELQPVGATDPAASLRALQALLQSLQDAHLRGLAAAYTDDEPFMERLMVSPAARRIHHAFRGGLLAHTVSVMQLSDRICEHYAEAMPGLVNRDLCLMGAFLHDLGKVQELSPDGRFDYTTEGRLLGHLLLGLRDLDARLAGLDGFPEQLAVQVRHLVAAHHGRLEHGSPKRPKTVEALIVHRADELDSTLAQLRDVFSQAGDSEWTAFLPQFDRYMYRGDKKG